MKHIYCLFAVVAELVDAPDLGSGLRVWVRVPSAAHLYKVYMKSIEEIIIKDYRKSCLENYFPDITIDNVNIDYILENLNTHDTNLLIQQLEKINGTCNVSDEGKGTVKLVHKEKLNKKETFINLLDFYGYYITKVKYDLDTDKYIYIICPKYSKNCSDFVYNECKGICYHICLTKTVESILKNGLRCKKANYRDFPKRIYVIAVPIKNINKLKDIIKNVFEELCFGDPSKYNILKINKGSHNKIGPDFYEDDIMKSNNTFYTYTNIPKEEITDLGSLKKFIE